MKLWPCLFLLLIAATNAPVFPTPSLQYVPTTRQVNTAAGLLGGGNLSSDLTLAPDLTILATKSDLAGYVSSIVNVTNTPAGAVTNLGTGIVGIGTDTVTVTFGGYTSAVDSNAALGVYSNSTQLIVGTNIPPIKAGFTTANGSVNTSGWTFATSPGGGSTVFLYYTNANFIGVDNVQTAILTTNIPANSYSWIDISGFFHVSVDNAINPTWSLQINVAAVQVWPSFPETWRVNGPNDETVGFDVVIPGGQGSPASLILYVSNDQGSTNHFTAAVNNLKVMGYQ